MPVAVENIHSVFSARTFDAYLRTCRTLLASQRVGHASGYAKQNNRRSQLVERLFRLGEINIDSASSRFPPMTMTLINRLIDFISLLE